MKALNWNQQCGLLLAPNTYLGGLFLYKARLSASGLRISCGLTACVAEPTVGVSGQVATYERRITGIALMALAMCPKVSTFAPQSIFFTPNSPPS
jgi:hypothetical protein